MQTEMDHPVWGKVDSDSRERHKQLLSMLCQHEADRLDTWAYPLKYVCFAKQSCCKNVAGDPVFIILLLLEIGNS